MRWVRPTPVDLVVAAVATVWGIASTVTTAHDGTWPDVVLSGFALAMTAPLAIRRTAPLSVVAVMSAALVAAAADGGTLAAGGLGVMVAVVSAAYLTDRRGALIAGGIFAVAAVAGTALALDGEEGRATYLVNALVVAVLTTLVGDVLRTVRERNLALQSLRDAQSREAVAQERLRIARDLHDVVGHALVAITLQARAATRLLDRDRDAAATALHTIDDLAARALEETRETVGLMRGPSPTEPAATPRLADLDGLVDHLQEDDMRVRIVRDGDVALAPPAVQTAAYRIVQEALSNVAKHARPADAVVTLALGAGELDLEIRDDGHRDGSPIGAAGHGLRGMRERAAQCGGVLHAGPESPHGWAVRARLPTTAPRR